MHLHWTTPPTRWPFGSEIGADVLLVFYQASIDPYMVESGLNVSLLLRRINFT